MANELTTTVTFSNGDQVTSAKLNQIISGASFGSGAVTGSTLTVTGGKLKVGTITASEMGSNSVTSTALASNSVTTAKISDGSVITAKLANLTVTDAKIANTTITLGKINSSAFATKSMLENPATSTNHLVTAPMIGYTLGVAKGFGEFSISSSSRSISPNSFNVLSVSRVDATKSEVSFVLPMSSSDYVVMTNYETVNGNTNDAVSVYDKLAGSFKVFHPTESAGRSVNFVVFGKFAS